MNNWLSIGISTLLAIGSVADAVAQDVHSGADDAQNGAGRLSGLEEVTVTAQRREESIQDVPLAISAISADAMEVQQIRSTLDVARFIPNMTGGNNTGLGSANTYFIRGIGNGETIATFDPSVATYVDEIYVARQNDSNFSFFDVERMEVLRGPQGTLFGRNSSGGAVNISMKKPADEFGGFAEASYGRYNERLIRASLDVPLTDKLLTKLSGFSLKSDGFVRSVTTGEKFNGQDNYGGRVDVRFLPTDSITWDLSADMINAAALGVYNEDVDDRRISLTGFRREPGALRGLLTGRKGGYGHRISTRSRTVRSNLGFDLSAGTLSFITGYRRMDDDFASDFFNGPYPTGGFIIGNELSHHAFSQEIKFASEKHDRYDYVVGVYYFDESNRTDIGNIFTIPEGANGIPLVLSDYLFTNDAEAKAIYGQMNYHLTDRLTGTLGLRYTDEVKDVTTRSNNNPLTPASANFDTQDVLAAGNPIQLNSKVWTPRVALSYQLNDDSSVYASVTRGFKSGGWNARSSTAETFTEFLPEKVWSYELGVRSEFPEQRLRLNATAFYSLVNDFQLPAGYETDTGAVFLTANFSDLRDYGLELEAVWEPIADLRISSSLGLQQADYVKVKDNILAQQSACRAGDAASCGTGIITPTGEIAWPQYTPHATWIGQVTYTWHIGNYEITPSAGLQIQGRRAVSTANVEGSIVDRTELLDLSVQLAPANGPWSLALGCRNCTDEVYGEGSVPPFVFTNRPGTWSLRGRWDF